MPKIISPQSSINDEGALHLKKIIARMKGKIEEIDIVNDFGFDFYIHLSEEKIIDKKKKLVYIPLVLRAQLKSGVSYILNESSESFGTYIKEDDIEVWRASNTPVVLIVYNPKEKRAYWTNIRKYIEESDYKGQGSMLVTIKKDKVLTKKSYLDFLQILYKEQRGLPYQQLALYKPIYNQLLGIYNTTDIDGLRKYQEKYENSRSYIGNGNINDPKYIQAEIDFILSQRKLYSLKNAITNFENLHRKLENLADTIGPHLRFLSNYYLCVLYIEDCRYYEAEHLFKIILQTDKKFATRETNKFNLLSALIYDGLGKTRIALKHYDQLIYSKNTKNLSLQGSLCIFAGVLCRRYDFYKKSERYLTFSINILKNNPTLLGIANSNLGNLFYTAGNYEKARTYYLRARYLYEKLGNTSGISATYKDLSNISRNVARITKKSYGDSYDLFRLSMQNNAKDDYEIVGDYQSEGHADLSEVVQNFLSKKTSKLEHDYYNGINNFKKSEIMYDHLGYSLGKRISLYQKGKYLYTIGKLKNDFSLLFHALGHHIILNNEDGIKAIANIGLNNNNKREFSLFLKWVYSIKGDKYAELGRLIFFKEFSTFIPERDMRKLFTYLIKYEKRGYSINDSFDFGRRALDSFGEIAERLSREQTKELYKIIKVNLSNKSYIVFDSAVDLLMELNYRHFTSSKIKEIIKTTKDIAIEEQKRRKIFFVWIKIITDTKNNEITKIIYDNILALKNHDIQKLTIFDLNALANTVFNNFRSEEINNITVDNYCNILIKEAETETINSYSGGGPNNSLILAKIFTSLNHNQKEKILDTIIKYLQHSNLISYKRKHAIIALSYIYKNAGRLKSSALHKVLCKIVNHNFTELKNRYFETDFFFIKNPNDFKSLKLYALMLLIQTKFTNFNYIFQKLSDIIIGELSESTILPLIITLGEIGLVLIETSYSAIIINYLLCYINDSDSNVLFHTMLYLSKFIKDKDQKCYPAFIFALNKHKQTSNIVIRLGVVKSCKQLLSNGIKDKSIEKMISDFSKDISREIREVAKQ